MPRGITPAYAGKSPTGQCCVLLFWDHPRVCGEKLRRAFPDDHIRGSPPRMRGKACAAMVSGLWSRDHPRVCGEKCTREDPTGTPMGSPPRMRGKGRPLCLCSVSSGITPAYAGKRYLYMCHWLMVEDHPRVCGEKILIVDIFNDVMGSPPRMRGKAELFSSFRSTNGITPAYAGKSYNVDGKKQKTWDHPRVCGEKFRNPIDSVKGWGSPPRMRGKDVPKGATIKRYGITPAYAGKR